MVNMRSRKVLQWLILALAALGLAGCAQSAAEPTPAPAPTRPPVAGAAPAAPPDVDDIAPAGICEDTANILSRVDRDEDSLFRALAIDNRVGSNDGDGIVGVRFVVIGEDLAYAKDETTAPYCIFGGNEPGCPPWPRDGQGRYVWGEGGPVVEPGRYEVFVEVVGQQADSATGRDRCDWSFGMTIR